MSEVGDLYRELSAESQAKRARNRDLSLKLLRDRDIPFVVKNGRTSSSTGASTSGPAPVFGLSGVAHGVGASKTCCATSGRGDRRINHDNRQDHPQILRHSAQRMRRLSGGWRNLPGERRVRRLPCLRRHGRRQKGDAPRNGPQSHRLQRHHKGGRADALRTPTVIATPDPPTKQDVLDAAAHWRKLADSEEAAAKSEIDQGLHRGDVSSFFARAFLYREVAAELTAAAERM